MSQLLVQHKKRNLGSDEEESNISEEEDEDIGTRNAGFIKKLTLKNFMCHDHFELSFGPHMNFIIGRNGSGKSAVLTGISVGLGAKAADTNRGSSIKLLIKDGRSMARIIIEIYNDGENAYEPETYGKSIFVERKISREGQNAYSIKSENGSVISQKKKTLDEILQKFFIVVNNPLSFLSQDKAREFIGSSSEQSRFACFSEGTNIQAIISNYEEISQKINKLQNRMLDAKTYYTEASKRSLESERLYKNYKKSHKLRQKSDKIHGKIYWFNVEVQKRSILEKENEISDKESEIQTTDSDIEKKENLIELQKEDIEAACSERKNIEEEFDSRQEKCTKVESLHEEATRKVQSVVSDLKNYKAEVENYTNQIKKHKEDLVLEQKKIDDANGGSKETMSQKLELLKNHQEKLTASRDEIQIKLNDTERTSPEMMSLKKELSDILSTTTSIRQKIASIEKTKSDRYAAFGINVGRLMRDIQMERSWHRKPIGPVGCYVSVKEEYSKWGDLINATLQRFLDSFVVCDEHDRKILLSHMRNNRISKNIIVRKFEQFSFNNQVSARYLTILNALEFQDEDAKFTLIDSSGIEEIVLCESVPEAENVTKDRLVKQAFCLNGRNSGVRLSRREGQLSRDPLFYSRDLRKLAGKVDSDSFTQDIQDLSRQEAMIKGQMKNIQAEEREQKLNLQYELEQKKSQLKKINNSIFTTQKSLLEEGDYGRIANLNSQIELCENQIKTREGMLVELWQNLNECKSNNQVLKEQLGQEKQLKNSVAEKLSECETQINRQLEALSILKADVESLKKRKRDIISAIDTLKIKILEGNKKLEDCITRAQEQCARSEVTISDSDTTKTITDEFRAIQRDIEHIEKKNKKPFDEVQRELLNNRALTAKCEKTLVEVQNVRIHLEQDLNARFQNLNATIREKLSRAKHSFESSLALRGFKGKLEFDFKNKRVVTEVQTEDNEDTRAVSSLSGGEKSFTQISFLLSIWKIMKPRVCGLDEFDVFMDSVNRTIAIRLLIHELRGSAAQSIFITPQDIAVVGDLQDSEDVKIHRISPPRND
ncbi:hypothetical protein JCM33374_g219 [Metschnikowia sp. JCM 33374]|nr:hypothetical protein JCM33374_g219 [Metschnikowia sp. JCM 33374]